ISLSRVQGEIVFDDVWFRYPPPAAYSVASLEGGGAGEGVSTLSLQPSDWILRGITLRAEPGVMTALVGQSGAGKTTRCHLIPRLHDVTSGAILLDGHDIRSLTLNCVRGAVGMVPQDPHLFHDTVAANLRFARPDATDHELEEACRAARIHELIG